MSRGEISDDETKSCLKNIAQDFEKSGDWLSVMTSRKSELWPSKTPHLFFSRWNKMQTGTLKEVLKLEIKNIQSKLLHSAIAMTENIANTLIKTKHNKD